SSGRSTSSGRAGSTASCGRWKQRPCRRTGPRRRPGTLCSMAQVGGTLEKALRFGEGRRMKRLQEQAAYITTLEPEFQALSDDELREKTVEFRQRLENGDRLEDLLFEAYAAVREARLRE